MNNISLNNKTFLISPVTDTVSIALVHIPRFISELFKKEIDIVKKTSSSIAFRLNDFSEQIYSENEITIINDFKIIKKQIEWMAGRYAVKLLINHTKNTKSILQNINVMNDDGGAPFIKDEPGYSVSISHSHDYAAAAVSTLKGQEVGIDIERKGGHNFKYISRVALTDREKEFVADRDDLLIETFTIKEAYLKYKKTGFFENLKNVEWFKKTLYFHNKRDLNMNTIIKCVENEYILSLLFNSIKGDSQKLRF